MKNKQIKRAIDTNLSSLRVTERDMQRIMTQVREGKRVKKKVSVALVLAVVLLLLTVTAVGVTLMNGIKYWEAKDGDIGSPLDMAVLDGRIYLTTEDGFFEWNPITEETIELKGNGIENIWSSLFVQDGQLKLLGRYGKLWRYEDGSWTLERDYNGLPLAKYSGKKSKLVCWEDCLFIPESREDGTTQDLLKLNLTDGNAEVVYEGNVLGLSDYRDGQFLAVLMIDEETERLVVMDAATGEITQEITRMHRFAVKGLTYDAVNDSIYAMIDGVLSLWNGQEWQAIRQATLPWLAHSFAVVGDLYLVASHQGIQSIQLDVQQPEEQITLTIKGVSPFNGQLDHAYQQTHANVSVVRQLESSWCTQDVEKAICGGDETDLFLLQMDASWLEMLKNETAQPIYSDKLNREMGNLSECFKELVTADGMLYAVVNDVAVTAWSKKISQVPSDFETLLSSKYSALTWDYQLWTQQNYIEHLIKQQIRESGANFDTPAFRRTLEVMKQNGLDKRSQAVVSTSIMYSMGNMFEMLGYIAPLRIAADKPEHYPATVHLYVLNPNSQHMETAIDFLEYTVSQMSAETRTMLCPEHAQPALLPFAEEWIECVKAEHAQDVKDGILPDDPAALEERIENLRNMPGHQLVTQEQIDFYKETIFPNLDFGLHPLLSIQNQETRSNMKETVLQYLQNERTLDETIQALTEIAEKAMQ